jgi:deazaflavin-dependent oxidoreductase (nitroreductase family)
LLLQRTTEGREMTPNTERADSGLDGEYVPSPLQYVRKQVAEYEATAGVHGGTLESRPVVILTSVGAKTGLVRKNPVMRIVDGDRYVAVASDGGASTNPSWYTNLVAHPLVRLQDGAVVRELRAREVSGDEKRYYWTVAQRFWPHFPEYRGLAGGRDIPIMVREPTAPRTPMATAARDAKSTLLQCLLSFQQPPGAAGFFAEDGVFEIPYLASLGMQPRYVGRQAIEGFLALILQRYPDWQYHPEEYSVLIDAPDQVFAEYEVHPTAAATGRRINHLFMGRCVVRNGQIVLLREALNTVAAAHALLPGGPAELAPPGPVVNSH